MQFDNELTHSTTLDEALESVLLVLNYHKSNNKQVFYIAGAKSTDDDNKIPENIKLLFDYRNELESKHGDDAFVFDSPSVLTSKVYKRLKIFEMPQIEREKSLQEFYDKLIESGTLDGIYFTPGWERSTGAMREHATARRVGVTVNLLSAQLDKVGQDIPKPFLKWVGGKGRLISQYKTLFPKNYNSYFEPFVGGGAVFFSLAHNPSYINDANQVLICAYLNIKNDVEKIIKDLSALEKHYHKIADVDSQKEFYYEMREKFNSLPANAFEKTSLLIFINKTCFNGLYRENSKGGFNVPFGKYKNPKICNENNLRNIAKAIRETTITCSAYDKAVESAASGDFVYFDPPYHPLNATSSFTSYHKGDFVVKDQENLRNTFVDLADRGCKVMLSNSDTPLIRELYAKFKIHEVLAGRAINSVGSKRGKITELVITNY